MGACARESCSQAFVDSSKAGRQRYCSARCGNTDAVARHRQSAKRASSPERNALDRIPTPGKLGRPVWARKLPVELNEP
ncbi:CGNR zinc finger domain-containing protein [Pseudarthrobacter sp. Y6]|uniref:CGNR zinc finger domain-containing protein n=1 Tax=Pseudarthrobacter sp. Y6 TaxID=3418422 RepID=UPI003CEE3CC4